MFGELKMTVLHEPKLDTILMIEKAIIYAEDHPTRMGLWKSLPRKVQYPTFKCVLDYLEASGKITFNDGKTVYTGGWRFEASGIVRVQHPCAITSNPYIAHPKRRIFLGDIRLIGGCEVVVLDDFSSRV